jgi:hypothetical protein
MMCARFGALREGFFPTKKAEINFGEVDLQHRNLLGIGIKNANNYGAVCTSKYMNNYGTE